VDADFFDTMTRSLASARSRRALAAALSGQLGIALGATSFDEVGAKKKSCPPCKKRKKGKCKKKKPDGTACDGGTCQNGRCCVPESRAATYAGAACGTARANNCGQAVTCTCPTGQDCLVNGSCAQPCTDPEECTACVNVVCGFPNTEGTQYCVRTDVNCSDLRPCSATTECPRGTHCQLCDVPTGLRCAPLCTG
jgi:hypothetical protein